MEVLAVHRNARMAPRKIRPVAALVRNMTAENALAQLQFLPGDGAKLIRRVLQSAIANATHNHNMKPETLKVSRVLIDEGIVMKRFNPVSRGMAHPIKKRTSHVTVVVDGEAGKAKKAAASRMEEISAKDYTAAQIKERNEGLHEEVSTDEKDSVTENVKADHDQEVFQNKKMKQQGGEKQKTHRRKSIG